MILSSGAIARAIAEREFEIEPYDARQLNPASYDLTLGDTGCVYVSPGISRREWVRNGCDVYSNALSLPSQPYALDTRRENPSITFKLDPGGFRITGRRTLLLHTRERIRTERHAWHVDGKSSLGRLGLVVHATAGYGDPGFDGQVTLEVFALGEDVIVYPGMRIAQVRFHDLLIPVVGDANRLPMTIEPLSYQQNGHYTGAASQGPVPSRSYLQFERDGKTDPAPPCDHACWCSDRMSGGLPCLPGKCPNVPGGCNICSRPDCDMPNGKH